MEAHLFTRGWVYVIVNKAMPGILKVGYTTKDSFLRAKQLSGSGVPHVPQILYEAYVEYPITVEQATHAMLMSKREGKEWFRCSKEEAITAIRACAGCRPSVFRIQGSTPKDIVLRERLYVDWGKKFRYPKKG